MLALRKTTAEPGLRLDEVPVPVPAADEVLVEVETASICGTDLHIYGWDEWSQGRIVPPLTLGHEFAGTVVEAGELVRNVAVGDYVSAESHITCGVCFQCRTGHAHMCERTRILGVDRDGAFARYVTIPGSVVWRNDRTKLLTGIAEGRGAVVLAADRTPFRLGLAGQMGATAVVNVEETADTAAWFLEHNEGYGFDVVFEMSGSPRAIADAFRIARNGGRVILFGIPSRPVEIDVAEALIFKNLSVLALNGRKIFETWYRTRWLLESGVVDVRPLITKELPLEEYEEAFALLAAGEACKIVVYPGGRAPAEAAEPLRERVPLEGRWQHR